MCYLRPKSRICSDDSHWYECAAVGKAKLCTFSLRATGASALLNAGVPERLIRDVTGHKSNALHLYERPTEQQKKQVSAVLVQGEEFGKENVTAPTNAIQQKIRHGASMCNSFSLVLVIATLPFPLKISQLIFPQLLLLKAQSMMSSIFLMELNWRTCFLNNTCISTSLAKQTALLYIVFVWILS